MASLRSSIISSGLVRRHCCSPYPAAGLSAGLPTRCRHLPQAQRIQCIAADPARPFDFIVDGELVRKSLDKHLLEHNISPEAVVEVEYVPAVAPPEPKSSIPHDDW
jgi:ribosome biogenesis protein YTM1